MVRQTSFKWMFLCPLLCALTITACKAEPIRAPSSPLSSPGTATAVLAYSGPAEMGSDDTSNAGLAWQRALLTWARARYAELSSGKVSAAGNTVVSWDLGPVADDDQSCKHLTVLSWGYAYAETRPCAGGNVQELKDGWLETAELEQLDPWLYERIPLYVDDNYVAGVGNLPITDAEFAEVAQWAEDVWQRLWTAP